MSQTSQQPPAGWYPDPAGSGDERYWDGGTWSQVTRPGQHPQDHVPGAATSYAAGRLAGWWWRVLAALLDYLVFFVPSVFVLGAMPFMRDLEAYYAEVFMAAYEGSSVVPELPQSVADGLAVFSLVMALVWFVYRAVMVALTGATLGQLVTGLRVVPDGAGDGIGWGRSFARAAVAVVLWQVPLIGPLAYALVPLFNPKRQTLHDMVARTLVVKK